MKAAALLLVLGMGATLSATWSATGSATAAETASSPAGVCQALVKAAQDKNYDAFMSLADMPGHKMGKAGAQKPKFEGMHMKYMDRLKDLSCGAEMVADDRAVVESASQGKKRLIPFVKADGTWKFDAKTYMAFYHYEGGKPAKK